MKILEQEYKLIEYEYDLISGKVNNVIYQKEHVDQYIHHYVYDASNRLSSVYTGQFEGLLREEQDASYKYYKHGPLARMEIGALKVQGLDYAYTINGWLKSVNGSMADKTHDMGKDGTAAVNNISSTFAPDQMAFVLNYFEQDYSSVKALTAGSNPISSKASSGFGAASASLYNGNIKSMEVSIAQFGSSPMGYAYKYDQLNRIIDAKAWNNYNTSTHAWQAGGTALAAYSNHFTYDGNGNILTQDRNGSASNTAMDNLTYVYDVNPSTDPALEKYTNKLIRVDDAQSNNGAYADDIDDQSGINYTYDRIGNLISDASEDIAEIKWNVYGKISRITRIAGSTKPDLEFHYSPDGHRTVKIVIPKEEGKSNEYTYYVRDAQGNVMATYSRKYSRVIDFANLSYAAINTKLVELTNTNVFGNYIGYGVHPSSTDLANELKNSVVNSSSVLADEVFYLSSPLNYLKYSGELPNILPNIELHARGEIYYSILESNGVPFSLLGNYCLTNNAYIPMCQSALTSDGINFLQAFSVAQPADYTNMLLSFEPSAMGLPIEDQIALLLANHTQLDLATFMGSLGYCETLKAYFQYLGRERSGLILGNYNLGPYLVSEMGEPSLGTEVLNYSVPGQLKAAINTTVGKTTYLNWIYTNDKDEFSARCAEVSPASVSNWQSTYANLPYTKQQYFELVKDKISAQVYDELSNYVVSTSTTYSDSLNLNEWHLYGSSRIGIYHANINVSYVLFDSEPASLNEPHSTYREVNLAVYNETYYQLQRGNKRYELTNHLGNVLTVVTDKKISTCVAGIISTLSADVISATDYSAFGAPLAGRTYQMSEYRFHFNGKEADNEINGDGNEYDFGARIYDTRIGKWFSTDAFKDVYASLSPYTFAANNPINIVDRAGHLLKDKDGNIIATSSGNKFETPTSSNYEEKGKIYVNISVYEEVTIYTDKGTPIQALRHVETYVAEKSDGKLIRTTKEPNLGAESNCHGYTFAGGKLVIEDNTKGSKIINLILNEDGYLDEGADESNASIFTLSNRSGFDHSGKSNGDGTWSADRNGVRGVPVENVDLETAMDPRNALNNYTTTFYKNETGTNQNINGVKTVSKNKAEKMGAKVNAKTNDGINRQELQKVK